MLYKQPLVNHFYHFVTNILILCFWSLEKPFIDTYAFRVCFIYLPTFRHKHPLSGFGHCGILGA